MGYFVKKADVAEGALKAVKNSVKVYNFHAKQLDDNMHIADTLNDKLQTIDPHMRIVLSDPRSALNRRFIASGQKPEKPKRQKVRPWSAPRQAAMRAAPSPKPPKLTKDQIRDANMARWMDRKRRMDYFNEHGRYAYMQADRMGKFGEVSSGLAEAAQQALQGGQVGQMAQNAMFAQGADMGEEIRNQQLEQIKKMRIKQNEATAPGTNQHRGMDPMKGVMKKMGESRREKRERLKRLEIADRAYSETRGLWPTRPGSSTSWDNIGRKLDMRDIRGELGLKNEPLYNFVVPAGLQKAVLDSLMEKEGSEEPPEGRLRRLEAWDAVRRRSAGRVFGREAGSFWRNDDHPYLGGVYENPWSAASKSDAKRRAEIIKLRDQLGKEAEEDNPYDRLKHLEAKVYAQDRDRYFSQYNPIGKSLLTTGHMSANPGGQAAYNRRLRDRYEIRSLRKQLGMKPHGLFGTGKILHDTSEEIEKARAAAQTKAMPKTPGTVKPISKAAAQVDSLGKNTSPAAQGATVEPPMPQTNYAKNTLENEFTNRINKKQLDEMNKLQRQQQNSGNQSTATSTTTSDGTTTTTTVGLANSGLMAALAIG